MSNPLAVLKFGSSVLPAESGLPGAVREIRRFVSRGERVLAVVSAMGRTTDQLLAQARRLTDSPEPGGLAALLATGEAVCAALLALALFQAGVRAAVLDPPQVGLRTIGPLLDAEPCGLHTAAVRRALGQCQVVVFPGFAGRPGEGQVSLLGRGGSDLSALFLAHRLGAHRCRMLKDVAGIYSHDPGAPGPAPRRFAVISYDDALLYGGRVVQNKALEYARRYRLSFEVGALSADEVTVVGVGPSQLDAGQVGSAPTPGVLLAHALPGA
jgi:homoserine dehydrogenase